MCIIALNESLRLPKLLASLPLGLEVIVVDSFSTDDTVAIAKAHGAKVFQRPFDDYASQKNFAVAKAHNDWVLVMDADETLHIQGDALAAFIAANSPTGRFFGAKITRRLIFMGKRLRYGRSSDRPLRLFRKSEGQFHGIVHEQVKLPAGKVAKLAGVHIDHTSYEDLTDYFNTFNRFTSLYAAKKTDGSGFVMHLFRPLIDFTYRYVFRLGFLDGYPGFTYALISSLYSFVKYAKYFEQAHEPKG